MLYQSLPAPWPVLGYPYQYQNQNIQQLSGHHQQPYLQPFQPYQLQYSSIAPYLQQYSFLQQQQQQQLQQQACQQPQYPQRLVTHQRQQLHFLLQHYGGVPLHQQFPNRQQVYRAPATSAKKTKATL